MGILDIIMIGIDISLFMYFYNVAINAPTMGMRLMSCLAMTMEVYFIRRHFKIMKYNSKINKNKE